MTKLNDKTTLKALRASIEEALAGITLPDGTPVTMKLGNCRYEAEGDSCRFVKLEIALADAEPQTAKDFRQYADVFGLDPEWLGKTFQSSRGEQRIVGLRVKARTKPVIVQDVRTGKQYIWPEDAIQRAMKLAEHAA